MDLTGIHQRLLEVPSLSRPSAVRKVLCYWYKLLCGEERSVAQW